MQSAFNVVEAFALVLVNLLKLRNQEVSYGPMIWANSYPYSPGFAPHL